MFTLLLTPVLFSLMMIAVATLRHRLRWDQEPGQPRTDEYAPAGSGGTDETLEEQAYRYVFRHDEVALTILSWA